MYGHVPGDFRKAFFRTGDKFNLLVHVARGLRYHPYIILDFFQVGLFNIKSLELMLRFP